MSKRVIVPVMLAATWAAGCQPFESPDVVYQRQRLVNVSYQAAFEAAERALGERFGIARSDSGTGVLDSRPREAQAESAGTRIISDALGTGRQGRRIADMRVVRDGAFVDVFCRVRVQELETEQFRVLERQRGAYDQPSGTPAEREAGTTTEQNAVWVTRSRDREMERSILEAVAEWVGRSKNNAG
jgi:hypothetical protein